MGLHVTALSLSVSQSLLLRLCVFCKTPRDNHVCNRHDTNKIEFTWNWVLSWLLCIAYDKHICAAYFLPGWNQFSHLWTIIHQDTLYPQVTDWELRLHPVNYQLARRHRCYLCQSFKKKEEIESTKRCYFPNVCIKQSFGNCLSYLSFNFVLLILIMRMHSYTTYSTC